MKIQWPSVLVLGAFVILTACGAVSNELNPSPDSYLYVWGNDTDANGDPNFLTVINSDPSSPNYGTLVTTVPTSGARGNAHHTSLVLPSSGSLFANDFRGNSSFIFDTSEPFAPTLEKAFQNKGDYDYAHTFSEIPNGNILAVFQTKGTDNPQPGGLVELTKDGDILQTGDAYSGDPNLFLRPYGLTIVPELDRAMTTNNDMLGAGDGEHIQIWELSSLSLLATLAMPEGPDQWRLDPYESRLLADGKTVMFNTLRCGLFVLSDIDGTNPDVQLVYRFEDGEICGLPHRAGNYWLQTIVSRPDPSINSIIVLDISDPLRPVEVSRLELGVGFGPHWLSPDITGTRLVLTGLGEHLVRRVMMLEFDSESATLSVDPNFGEGDEFGPGFMLDRQVWPHGETGPARAHGAVFWPPASPDWK